MVLDRPGPADGEGPLRLASLDDPRPGPGEVLVDVRACAVCRTDLQLVEGDLPARRLPVVPGHQVVGVVREVGDGTSADLIGRRVGIAWLAGVCGGCRFCRSGRENLCAEARFTGWDTDGGYATAVTARSEAVHLVPDGFDDHDAAPLLCGGVIGYRSLKVAGVGPASSGLRLGLYGFGASASQVIQVARHWGCEIYVCTRSEREQRRAADLGATWTGGYDRRPPVPLDAAITFAPAGSVVVAALRALDRGATVAVNAIHLDHIPAFSYDDLWWERSIRSVANVTFDDVRSFLQVAAALPVRSAVEVLRLDEANLALSRLRRGDVSGALVLDLTASRRS